ncbi:A24 family peptidase [Aliiroseovarius sp. YM-037]|uniref:A24 family peptidase n=1 Tax=Aliiroseovarius sp. YM-037 TaxID=3341728 RepID=UPI003A7F95A6
MDISETTALWFLPVAAPIAIWAAFSDLKTMKIPNNAVIALVLAFAVVGLFALPLADYAWRYVHLIVVLGIGIALNMAGAIGAGDAKFAAAMAPFIALGDIMVFLIVFAVVLIAAFVTHRVFSQIPQVRLATQDWESWGNKDFPMGLALGGALIAYLVLGAMGGI